MTARRWALVAVLAVAWAALVAGAMAALADHGASHDCGAAASACPVPARPAVTG